ncbi:MAG: hypothetical protein DMD44_09630 [Gemmatimonadetes bacterium]|nr:MAG: hypothetical protein DMD44_09630 [Gemmatimonadota bacterium]
MREGHERGHTGREQIARGRTIDGIAEGDASRLHLADPAAHPDQIVVARRRAEADIDLGHREVHALLLQLFVGDPGLAHQLGAGAIEPDQVVGVVDHAHLIGLGVVDAERYRADHAGATSTADRQKSNTTGACGRFAGFLAWGVPAPASRVLVVADAHLGQVPPAVAAAFHRFLDAVPDLGDALLINGDLFDFWFEYRAVIPRRHFGTIAKLHSVRTRGVPVTFVGGNHDRWGGDFLTKDLGIAFYAGEAEIDVAGRRAFVAHGDGLTEQHWSARLMHRVTRHAATIRLFRALHPDLGFWIAHQLSRKLADTTRDRAVLDRAERAQARYAEELLARRPDLQLAILAHTHRPAIAELPNGRAYVNPGAFLDGGRYAMVTRDGIELKTFQ